MTEFLTENARRSYPLEHEWPSSVDDRMPLMLLDASVSYSEKLGDSERISVLKVRKHQVSTSVFGIEIRIGISDSSYVDVTAEGGTDTYANAYAGSTSYKAILGVNPVVIADLLPDMTVDTWVTVGVPLAMRCCSCATRFVSSIAAHSPATLCSTPVFGSSTAHEVVKSAVSSSTPIVDTKIVADEGIDVEVTTNPQIDGNLLRISAITAPEATVAADENIDMVIRGDNCITVEAIPGAYVTSGGAVVAYDEGDDPKDEETDCGVIRIGTKCKPCCQCEDYKDAVDALRPEETALSTINTALNAAKTQYNAAKALLDEINAKALAAVNAYANIHASATAATSGGVYSGSTATGNRKRVAVTLLIDNMTKETATISAVGFTMPTSAGLSLVKLSWSTAGSNPRTGTSIDGETWDLASGDTLSVVATYATTAQTNAAEKPTGATATYTAKLPSRTSSGPLPVTVK